MSRDHGDALIDHLLREELGGDRPRDLTARVLAMAEGHDRRRRAWWIGSLSAAAAVVAIGVTLFALWPNPYPKPNASGDFVIADGGKLQRGARIETNGAANLTLGGYVDAAVDAHTKVTLGGDKFEEKLLVEQGGVTCKVEKKVGKFDVVVGPADVHVTGTRFSVKVREYVRDRHPGRNMYVVVESGEVVVSGVPGRPTMTLTAGKRENFFIPTEGAALVGPATATTKRAETQERTPKAGEHSRDK